MCHRLARHAAIHKGHPPAQGWGDQECSSFEIPTRPFIPLRATPCTKIILLNYLGLFCLVINSTNTIRKGTSLWSPLQHCTRQLHPPEVSASTPLSSATFKKIWKAVISVSENYKRSKTAKTASGDAVREHKTNRCSTRTEDTGFIPCVMGTWTLCLLSSFQKPVCNHIYQPFLISNVSPHIQAFSHVSDKDLVTTFGETSCC